MKDFVINPATVVLGADPQRLTIQQGGLGAKEITFDREDALMLQQALAAWLWGETLETTGEEKVAVMLGRSDDTGMPIIILGMGHAAWDYCKDGKTHNFDLTAAGLPVQLMIAGGPTRQSVIEMVEHGMKLSGGQLHRGDENRDLGIKMPTER